MIKYIVFLSLLVCSKVVPCDVKPYKIDKCLQHPIYCQILKNSPKINKQYAMRLSNVIDNMSKLYKLDSAIYTAILAQESMFKLNAKNCRKGFCYDHGISQINYKTALIYNFNLNGLTTDLVYSVQAGAIVLADLRKAYAHKDKDYWTRYNASNKLKRAVYKAKVIRYL